MILVGGRGRTLSTWLLLLLLLLANLRPTHAFCNVPPPCSRRKRKVSSFSSSLDMMAAAAASLPNNNNHHLDGSSNNPTSSIHASASIPMHAPGMSRSSSSSSTSGTPSRRIGGFVPAPSTSTSSPPPLLADDDYASPPPPPQRQLVWGEEELRSRIREVEEDGDTLRSTALAHCMRGQRQKAEATLVRLYSRDEGRRYNRLERVGLPLALSYLELCTQAEAWAPALDFIDDVLLYKAEEEEEEDVEKETRGEGEGQATTTAAAAIDTQLASRALHACVGAGDARRVLALLKRTPKVTNALIDLSLQACAAQQQQQAAAAAAAEAAALQVASAATRRRKDDKTAGSAVIHSPPLGVLVLSLLREARRRGGEGGARDDAIITPSTVGWEAAAAALTAAGSLRLLLAEAKQTATPPMWLYGKAIAASVKEGQEAEALLLYQEVVERSHLSESENDKDADTDAAATTTTSTVIPLSIHEHALGAYAAQGQWRPALAVLDRLKGQAGEGPSLVCFNAAIRACCLGNEWERGVGLLRRMEAAGHRPNEGTYSIILQAFAKTGEWQGSLKLLEYIEKKAEGGREENTAAGVTPALARAAAEICVRASRFEEARTLVGSVVNREEEGKGGDKKTSPAVLALGLWSLAAATPTAWRGPARQEEALSLITQLIATGAPIALETYEHACQALLLSGGGQGSSSSNGQRESSSGKYDAALREVYRHGIAKGVLPSSSSKTRAEETTPTVELRGLRPTLAKVAMITALEELDLRKGGGEKEGQSPALIIITGTGRVKTALQQFLRTSCQPSLLPQPMPYNAGRLLLPWAQIQRWKESGEVSFLSGVGR